MLLGCTWEGGCSHDICQERNLSSASEWEAASNSANSLETIRSKKTALMGVRSNSCHMMFRNTKGTHRRCSFIKMGPFIPFYFLLQKTQASVTGSRDQFISGVRRRWRWQSAGPWKSQFPECGGRRMAIDVGYHCYRGLGVLDLAVYTKLHSNSPSASLRMLAPEVWYCLSKLLL